jgi:hypothetical protein
MMIPKAYLLIVARPPRRAATVTPSRQRKKHPAAKLLTKDEARRIATNAAKLTLWQQLQRHIDCKT